MINDNYLIVHCHANAEQAYILRFFNLKHNITELYEGIEFSSIMRVTTYNGRHEFSRSFGWNNQKEVINVLIDILDHISNTKDNKNASMVNVI